MIDFIIGPVLVFLLFGGWILTQSAARAFAKRHPELGPFREEGGGSCGGGHCHSCEEQHGCGTSEHEAIQPLPGDRKCGKSGC